LRPETAQGIFVNFKRLIEFNQNKLPMIVAQVGKSFRNEINPKGGLLRQREFLMAEIEHFLSADSKYAPFDKFSSVENLEIYLLTKDDQLNSLQQAGHANSKIKLKEAIEKKIIKSEIMAYYIGRAYLFCLNCGVDAERIRFREHLKEEMAHYANECWDLECLTSHVISYQQISINNLY
jgi:glycyl-tRNA synthetase